MSARFYDEAIILKFKNWIKDENMTITSPSETKRLFEYIADIESDNPIKLPLIALRRDSTANILSTNKKALTFSGARKFDNNKGAQLNAIPIELRYQLDIYTRYYNECEDYIRSFIFNIINYPKVLVKIPYNGANIEHVFNLRLNSEVQDNSDIPERLTPGEFTRKTLSFYIDDAYLFDYKVKDILNIEEANIEINFKEDLRKEKN